MNYPIKDKAHDKYKGLRAVIWYLLLTIVACGWAYVALNYIFAF